jgi:anthranilate phosphoribosyltransferase
MSKSDVEFAALLKRLAAGEHLSAAEAATAFGAMMAGTVSEIRMASFLTALAARGPTIAEITGAARAMREAMTTVEAPPNAIDVCGTGGDGAGTLNVSTATAFVLAGSGVPVAKHGNRAMSSRTGAADVLEVLGVPINHDAAAAKKYLHKPGFAFLFAPAYHPAMKHVAPVRKELGFRTVFNLLGPICNPARVRRQLLGIFAEEWLEPVAHVLADLGTEKAWIVHGADGLDELTTTGITRVAVLDQGHVALREIAPEDAGLKRTTLSALKGGSADENARAIREVLGGAKNAFRDIVLLNAGAALVVADRAKNIAEGVAVAAEVIDKGRAASALEQARSAERAKA